MNKFKEKITLNPVMTFLILILATIVLSGFLNLIGFEATYNQIDTVTGEYKTYSGTFDLPDSFNNKRKLRKWQGCMSHSGCLTAMRQLPTMRKE